MKDYMVIVTLEFTWEDGARGTITKEFVLRSTSDEIVTKSVQCKAEEYRDIFRFKAEPKITSAKVIGVQVFKEIYAE